MTRYYCEEDARNLVLLEIENRRKALALYSQIIECVKNFNGKKLNKRFDTALKQIDKNLKYTWEGNRFTIEFSTFDSRCIESVKGGNWNYISGFSLTLNTMLNTWSYDKSRTMLDDDGRIISHIIIKYLEERKHGIEHEIKELEEKIEKAQEYKNRLEALRKEMENVMGEVPYIIREYFDINYRVENR